MFKKRILKVPPRKRERSEELQETKESSDAGYSENTDSAEIVNVQELIALRKLQKSQLRQGIEVEKLNRGDVKKRPATEAEDETAGYGLQPKPGTSDEAAPAAKDEERTARSIVRSNNFTQQTNALDVDKHMMTYIEEGLKKRRGERGIKDDEPKPDAPYDPLEELFKIDGRYRLQKNAGDEEGSVTNSAAMLTAIPEVDLGMDVRLRNIEETEKAKRVVADERRARLQQGSSTDPDLGATRFFRPYQHQQSDAEALRVAKLAAQGIEVPETRQYRGERRETATDEQVMERFKKRMRK